MQKIFTRLEYWWAIRKIGQLSKNEIWLKRNALLNAAEFIRNNPKRYDFLVTDIPVSHQGSGCIIGWIAFFAGYKNRPRNYKVNDFCEEYFLMPTYTFYQLMRDLGVKSIVHGHDEIACALEEFADHLLYLERRK